MEKYVYLLDEILSLNSSDVKATMDSGLNAQELIFSDGDYLQECLLGSIMSVTTEEGKDQLIGGQDGAILLLLKALRENLRFHEQLGNAKLKDMCFTIDRLVHGLNNCGLINEKNSRIAMQGKDQGFLNILLTGKVSEDDKIKYAENYRFFQNKILRLTVAQ